MTWNQLSITLYQFRTYVQHPARVAYGKDPDTKLKIAFFFYRE